MQIQGNTILVTGGGSGIGRALAEAFHHQGNQVVISGRRKNLLEEVMAANRGMKAETFDMTDAASVADFGAKLPAHYPTLNVVIHNAGVMSFEDLRTGKLEDTEATIATNLLGPIRLTAALMPHLLAQKSAAILTVSSGIAFVPNAAAPTYSATKAAIHSWTQALRYQMRGTTVQVIELAPPYVQTELTGEHQANDPNAMPLKDYIDETMQLLRTEPDATEILVERVKAQRFAASSGNYDQFFEQYNGRVYENSMKRVRP